MNSMIQETSLSNVSCKKEKVKAANPNGTPKTLIVFERWQKLIRAKKPRNKSNDDQIKHLQGYTKNATKANWETKCSKTKWMIKTRPMMWVLTTRERKIQEGKTHVEHHNAQKWINAKRTVWQMDHLGRCPSKNGWWTFLPKECGG